MLRRHCRQVVMDPHTHYSLLSTTSFHFFGYELNLKSGVYSTKSKTPWESWIRPNHVGPSGKKSWGPKSEGAQPGQSIDKVGSHWPHESTRQPISRKMEEPECIRRMFDSYSDKWYWWYWGPPQKQIYVCLTFSWILLLMVPDFKWWLTDVGPQCWWWV